MKTCKHKKSHYVNFYSPIGSVLVCEDCPSICGLDEYYASSKDDQHWMDEEEQLQKGYKVADRPDIWQESGWACSKCPGKAGDAGLLLVNASDVFHKRKLIAVCSKCRKEQTI